MFFGRQTYMLNPRRNFKYLQKEHVERIFDLKYSRIFICFACNNITNLF